MVDPETLAALAGQVDEIRGQVAKLQQVVTQWSAKLEREGIGATLVLRSEVKRLADTLAEAIEKHKLAPPPAPFWHGLSRDEQQAQLAEVREWVARVARPSYLGYFESLPDCWAAHGEAVIELANLMTEWHRIYGDPDNRDLASALWWHERWLPGVLGRLEKAIKCDATGCKRLPPPWERSPPPKP